MMTDYLKKINALLAKAASTHSAHEAEAFSRKAEELMVKWGINDAMLESSSGDVKSTNVIEQSIHFHGIYAKAMAGFFGPSIVRGLGSMKMVLGHSGTSLYIIGMPSDVNRAVELIGSLDTQAMAAMRRWWKDFPSRVFLTGSEGYRERRAFLIAFGRTVQTRLENLRREEESTESTATALAVRSTAVDEAFAEMYPSLRASSSRLKGSSYGGRVAGESAGRNAGLSTTKIGTGSTVSIGR